MCKKLFFIYALLCSIFFFCTQSAYAVENPLARPNNIFGIHILFPSELRQAAALVNSNNGDWGYVTIPIQAGDKDLFKWQKFMDECRSLHVIPLIRLATEGDYFNTRVWRKPNYADVLDFANFLSSLHWSVKNHYIIFFNEVNRDDEWGGKSNPTEYANLLSYATTVFKSRSQDYFIISAGMDNAAETTAATYNEYDFFNEMNAAVPGIFNQIDGIGSHSYPNPGFLQPPNVVTRRSISSFQYEREFIESLTIHQLPVFITETGWPSYVGTDSIPIYYKTAFATVWTDKNIVAVTPFLLNAADGPFVPFSFLLADGSLSTAYKAIEEIPKIKGNPSLPARVLGEAAQQVAHPPVENFAKNPPHVTTVANISKSTTAFFKWLLGM